MGCGPSKETPGLDFEQRTEAKSRQAISTQNGSVKEKRKVQPGYSSGASLEDQLLPDEAPPLSKSNVLDLSTLRKEMAEEGDITKSVVRIETPFGKPIDECYNGVHNGPILGTGVSGIVRLVTHRATGVNYACKCLDIGLIESTEALRQLRTEIFIMCQLDHPNIVRIEEVYESTDEIYILQELCKGGDLFDRLQAQPDYHPYYTEAQCARLIKQMLSAVRYLHDRGIIHRDLKLENFLFSSPKPDSELKMIDFGLSKHFELGQFHHEQVGTPYTVAPEIINGRYDEKADIWAIGVITYLLLSGETPFGGLDQEDLMLVKQNIMQAKVMFEPAEIWDQVSDQGKAFVKRLLQADPSMRPTAKDAQRDEWIQVWAKKDIKEGSTLNAKTLESLVAFKECSDAQKVLSEVLSFTLLPDQMASLQKEFELIDSDGDGEITFVELRIVLIENAEAGLLGALTEQEIEDIFDAIKTRKNELTIRWHEFLAAGLEQCHVDDRNLRLAFDRLDTNGRGYISLDDLENLLGNNTEYGELEKIWRDSLKQCACEMDKLTFDDFKKLMKGQSRKRPSKQQRTSCRGMKRESDWDLLEQSSSIALLPPQLELDRAATIAFLPSQVLRSETDVSPLVSNRALYRRNRLMRLSIIEASKQIDKMRQERTDTQGPVHASLIMKHGDQPPVGLEDAHTRALFESAAKRCGRIRRSRNKTASDVTGMLAKAPV